MNISLLRHAHRTIGPKGQPCRSWLWRNGPRRVIVVRDALGCRLLLAQRGRQNVYVVAPKARDGFVRAKAFLEGENHAS